MKHRTIALSILLVGSLLVGPIALAGGAAAEKGPPGGMVGVPDQNVGPPEHAQGNGRGGNSIGANDQSGQSGTAGPPGDVQLPSSVPTHAAAWDVVTSRHADDLEIGVGQTTDGALALVLTDDQNHAGREVAVDAKTLKESVGYQPRMAYGLHENGSEWSSEIQYEGGYAALEVPHFSSNTVTFNGSVEINASPASNGSSWSYDLNSVDSVDNFEINVAGTTSTAWDNETATNISTSGSASISPAGNLDPTGPTNNNPEVELSLPIREYGSVTDATNIVNPQDIAVDGNYAYIASYDANHVTVVDISSSSNPSVVATVNLTGGPEALDVSGDHLYVAYRTVEFSSIDISDPENPSIVDTYSGDGTDLKYAKGLSIDGSYAYISANVNNQLNVFDISDPTSLSRVSSLGGSTFDKTTANAVGGSGDYVYVTARDSNTLSAVDITDPTSASVAGSVTDDTDLADPRSVAVDGNYAYVGAADSSQLTVVDISDPTSPTIAATLSDPAVDNVGDIEIDGDYLYTKDGGYTIVDISNPTSPSITATKSISSPEIALDSERAWGALSGENELVSLSLREAANSVDVSDGDGETVSFGSLESGDTVSKEFDLSRSSTSLDLQGSGDAVDVDLRMRERTETEDVEIDVNGNTTSTSGNLGDGGSETLSADSSWIQNGTNNISVITDLDNSLSTDAPTSQVDVVYRHEAADEQTINYDSEAYSERYNVSKQFASDQSSATLTIPFETTMLEMRTLETRTNESGDWMTVAESDYSLDGTNLTVQLGDVPAGATKEVRATGSKVQVDNGAITVTEATPLGEELSTEISIDSHSEGFAIAVNATEYNENIHYTYSESWNSPESYAHVDHTGDQELRLPKAGVGSTTRIGTVPLEMGPTNGHVDVRIVSSGAEPEFEFKDTSTADSTKVIFKNTESGAVYQLYNTGINEEIAREEASSPVPFTVDSPGGLSLAIFDLGLGGSGDGGGGPIGPTGESDSILSALSLPLSIIAGLAAVIVLFLAWQRGPVEAAVTVGSAVSGSISGTASWLRNNPAVSVFLLVVVGLLAVGAGVVPVPEGGGTFLLITGAPLVAYLVLVRWLDASLLAWGVVTGVAVIAGLQLLGSDIIGSLVQSEAFPILAIGAIVLGYYVLQAQRAEAETPDEVNRFQIGGLRSQNDDGGSE